MSKPNNKRQSNSLSATQLSNFVFDERTALTKSTINTRSRIRGLAYHKLEEKAATLKYSSYPPIIIFIISIFALAYLFFKQIL